MSDSSEELFADAAAALSTSQRWQQVLREELATPLTGAGARVGAFLASGQLRRGQEAAGRVRSQIEGGAR